MSIRVTCSKCHTRFNVSDQFAGKEGPCPKCKSKIKIPDKTDEVVIEAPASSGPLDTKGRPVLKPIERIETKLSGVQITLIISSIVGFLAAALVMRIMVPDRQDFPIWLLGLSALAIAPPLVYSAYSFLRNQDLDAFFGKELGMRVAICSVVYSLTWLAMPLACFAFNDSYEVGSYVTAGVGMIGIGGLAGMLCFDLDYLMGSVHYGFYMGVCLLGRWLAGLGVLPTDIVVPVFTPPAVSGLDPAGLVQSLATVCGLG